jgi:hypothetical protein
MHSKNVATVCFKVFFHPYKNVLVGSGTVIRINGPRIRTFTVQAHLEKTCFKFLRLVYRQHHYLLQVGGSFLS